MTFWIVGETWTYTVSGTAITGNYSNKGTVTADDPFGTEVMSMDTSNYVGIQPAIDIEKATNGFQADQATDSDVPEITVGADVTWTYVVTNTGTTELTDVDVVDSDIGAVTNVIDQGNGDAILDVSESWTLRASGIATAGPYENSAVVTGTAPDGAEVTDTDLSHYVGLVSGIDIEKSTNGEDADTTGSGPEVFVGSTVTFTYNVINTGAVPLANVVVTDDNGTPADSTDNFQPTFVSGDTNGDDQLDVAETWIYTATTTAVLGEYQNIAVVSAEDDAGTVLQAADPSNHTGIAVPDTISKRRFLASSF